MKISKSLKKLKGDASLRTFFRNKKKLAVKKKVFLER